MEMWWAGFLGTPEKLLAGLAGTFALLVVYNLYAGLRQDAHAAEILIDSVEELGIGLASAAVVLWLLDRIQTGMAPLEIVGKVVVEGMVMAIGVSVGTAQLGGDVGPGRGDGSPGGQGAAPAYRDKEPWRHLGLAACGAVLLAVNVAPTDEIMVLAAELPGSRVIGVAILSFCVGAVILHHSDFRASRPSRETGLLSALHVTVQSYAIAMLVSAALLWFFGRVADASLEDICAQVVVLGFAAMLGASAGRLLLEPSR
jgi:putative integral membrane protein (TIGR02587 family)